MSLHRRNENKVREQNIDNSWSLRWTERDYGGGFREEDYDVDFRMRVGYVCKGKINAGDYTTQNPGNGRITKDGTKDNSTNGE